MTKAVSDFYLSDDLWGKYSFVNLNGLFERLSGRTEFNNVSLLKNGMLGEKRQSPASSALPGTVPAFSDYVESIGGTFLYVQAPYKMDLQNELLPLSFTEYWNASADSLLEDLEAASVQTLDLRSSLAGTAEQIEKYFNKTDHHWTADGAFVAFREIMQKLQTCYDPGTDLRYTDESLWERHVLENWFLGSFGKRTGSLYAGTDPLIWYTPAFETKMSCIIPHLDEVFRGSYADANLRKLYLEERDLFHYNAYCVCIGGDYPLVQHRNRNAPNKEKVLLLADSFALPVEACLSTEFEQIDVIDPRRQTAYSIAEYCAWAKPDIVIMLYNPSTLFRKAFAEFGSAPEYIGEKTILSDYDVTIPASDSEDAYQVLPFIPEAGKTYCFSFESFTVSEGSPDGLSVMLYNSKTDSRVAPGQIFPLDCFNYPEGGRCCFKVPAGGSDNADYQLRVYAGISGKTANIGVSWSGISVSELLS